MQFSPQQDLLDSLSFTSCKPSAGLSSCILRWFHCYDAADDNRINHNDSVRDAQDDIMARLMKVSD